MSTYRSSKSLLRTLFHPPKDGTGTVYALVASMNNATTPQTLELKIQKLAPKGFDLRRGGRCGWTLLGAACAFGTLELVVYVLNLTTKPEFALYFSKETTGLNPKEVLARQTNMAGWSVLHQATKNADPLEALRISEYLIRETHASVRVVPRDTLEWTPTNRRTPTDMAFRYHSEGLWLTGREDVLQKLQALLDPEPTLLELCGSALTKEEAQSVQHLLPPALWHLWHPKTDWLL